MPECQARFCTVRRGQGFHTFSIPDPKRDYNLCKRWIHNLGNNNLNIKTFVFAYHKVVCEKHFEEDCFEDDVEARLMNFKPRKKLKRGAVPTIFLDSKIPKKREASERRKKEKEKLELLENILGNAGNVEEPSCSNEHDEVVEQKRKGGIVKKGKRGKSKKIKTAKSTEDVGIQCDYDDVRAKNNVSTQCDFRSEHPMISAEFCVNCECRRNPDLAISDHRYSKSRQNSIP
ncbi:THAP domain-containing protein 3-like [Ostrea edulis]|uniref:THAP domain-containing protein 3-like n=1 Tax=Ostrea edulis TaxID=37623 RepID=UPI0024AF07F0|nr:THAP domain-containing protein 3-like [Ostrea edulis]